MISDYITNIQSDATIHNKTDIQENQPNKGASKKPMIQQALLLKYIYTKKRSLSLSESTIERDLVNGARIIDTSK